METIAECNSYGQSASRKQEKMTGSGNDINEVTLPGLTSFKAESGSKTLFKSKSTSKPLVRPTSASSMTVVGLEKNRGVRMSNSTFLVGGRPTSAHTKSSGNIQSDLRRNSKSIQRSTDDYILVSGNTISSTNSQGICRLMRNTETENKSIAGDHSVKEERCKSNC
jgi:hypothetical protein